MWEVWGDVALECGREWGVCEGGWGVGEMGGDGVCRDQGIRGVWVNEGGGGQGWLWGSAVG